MLKDAAVAADNVTDITCSRGCGKELYQMTYEAQFVEADDSIFSQQRRRSTTISSLQVYRFISESC